MKILVLFLRYGTSKYPNSFENFKSQVQKNIDRDNLEFVIIDNSLESYFSSLMDDYILIGGDNSNWEFSGWDRGLDFAFNENKFDGVLFVTDAFNVFHTDYINCFRFDSLKLAVQLQAAVGHIDRYPEPVLINNKISRSWIRTSCFFIPSLLISKVGLLAETLQFGELFSYKASHPFKKSLNFSDNFFSYISGWLTGSGKYVSPGITWHSKFDLTEDNLDFFYSKVSSIILERGLTLRLQALNILILDIEWLVFMLNKESKEENWWSLPLDGQVNELLYNKAFLGI